MGLGAGGAGAFSGGGADVVDGKMWGGECDRGECLMLGFDLHSHSSTGRCGRVRPGSWWGMAAELDLEHGLVEGGGGCEALRNRLAGLAYLNSDSMREERRGRKKDARCPLHSWR